MTRLHEIRKPSGALIKLVEAAGILLQVPKSFKKSEYKAPTPSNYDNTIELLKNDYSNLLSQLANLTAADVTNEMASELYAKTLEDGFSYENAVAAGGLCARDLFNSITLILDKLNAETYRIPIKRTNLLVLVDGSRPSYVALDTATHIHNHGVCTVGSLKVTGNKNIRGVLIETHLKSDLERRCVDQYKMKENSFEVVEVSPETSYHVVDAIEDIMQSRRIWILVLGIDTNILGTENLSKAAQWAAWNSGYNVVLVKSCSPVRPFTTVVMPRRLLICVKCIEDINDMYEAALTMLKPGDYVVFASIIDPGTPIGDNTMMRYDMGARYNWVTAKPPPSPQPNCVGWNSELIRALENRMQELLQISQVPGHTRLECHSRIKTVGQELCSIANDENVDMMLLRRGVNREVSVECVADSPCSVILID